MKLQKIMADNLKELSGKKICCFEYTISYIEEFIAVYSVKDKIEVIVDENVRNRGMHRIAGRNIEVCGPEYFETADLSDSVILITSDYYMEAYEKLTGMAGLKSSVDTVYYFVNKETGYELLYRDLYRETPLKNMVVFRSGPHASAYVEGMDYADNARALFEYMLENGYNGKYELIWLVKNPSAFRSIEEQHENVRFLSFDWSVSDKKEERDAYYQALCLAKYIFMTDAYGFARNCRKDQTRVQLWHGCGFKTRVNFVRCEKRYEYTTVISDLYAKIHQEIYGLRKEQVLVTGYAKNDWLFNPALDWREKLGIPKAGKYVFWLPTFRTAKKQLDNLNEYELAGQTGLPVVSGYDMLERLDELLTRLDMVLVIKLHPFQRKEKIPEKCIENLKGIVMLDNGQLWESDIPINRLLGHADALISDYSSAAVDFMLLDRPIAFTLNDVEEYEKSRGFVFENIREWLPGEEIFTFDELCAFVEEVSDGSDREAEKRRRLRNQMHRYHDEQNCRRIAEKLSL